MRWMCTCSYDGTHYAGWQTQDGHVSVQQVIEEALEQILKAPVRIQGSGRTDAGVHALEQVFHFDFGWQHGGERLTRALSTKLPKSIRVESAKRVDDSFHARFSAVSKRYHYRLFLGDADPFRWPFCWSVSDKLDLGLIRRGMDQLLGRRDFAAFASNRGIDYESTVRELRAAELSQSDEYVFLTFEADGFMYKMARSLTGCLVNIGLERMSLDDLSRVLENAERTPLVQAAPARGLFLEKVFY